MVACGGRGNQQTIGNTPQGEYHEMITVYENIYNSDSLLIKVTERDYAVILTLKTLEKTRTYEYEYQKLPNKTTEQRKYFISGNNQRELLTIKKTSPLHEEITELRNGKMEASELKQFDTQGRLLKEESRSEKSYSGFGMAINRYDKTEFEYDTLGRITKKTVRTKLDGDVHNHEITTTYRENSDEIISENYRDLTSGKITITQYRSEYSGDTLIMKVYGDNEKLSRMTKKASGYFAEIAYDSDKPYIQDEKIIVGNVETTISHEFERNIGDTLRYENGLLMREVRITPEMHHINNYFYDSKRNVSRHQQQVWFLSNEI